MESLSEPKMSEESLEEESDMKCILCGKETKKEEYCKLHMNAYNNVLAKYENWKRALGISWKEYLSQVVENPLTGEWAREVAKNLKQKEEILNGQIR